MKVSLWAQALDNQSDDHFLLEGAPLPPGDPRGREVIALISRVMRSGKLHTDSASSRCFMLDREVVIEISPASRDEAGRISPIQGHMMLSDDLQEGWGMTIAGTFASFASEAGRPISTAQQDEIARLLDAAKKKTTTRKPGGNARRIWFLVAAAFLGIWLMRSCQEDQTPTQDRAQPTATE